MNEPVYHQPHRGDEIEAWIKAARDGWDKYTHSWEALNDLLEDYRLKADTGMPLSGEDFLRNDDIANDC
jgi:hypothetical protein